MIEHDENVVKSASIETTENLGRKHQISIRADASRAHATHTIVDITSSRTSRLPESTFQDATARGTSLWCNPSAMARSSSRPVDEAKRGASAQWYSNPLVESTTEPAAVVHLPSRRSVHASRADNRTLGFCNRP